ncbi:hypothetical protein ACH4U6_12035 [Streptomyces netropsis]|uniref:hypothetical protein n=1 Tax=Streptomyces netropsis TaxID=55404 RepID=UPI00379EC010
MVLMVLGGSAGCGGEGTGAPEAASSKGATQQETFPDPDVRLDAEGLRKALPELRSMPTGWRTGVVPTSARDVPQDKRCADGNSSDCYLMWSTAVVQYKAPGDTGSVYIQLSAYPDRRTAGAALKGRNKADAPGNRAVSMPTVGNESVAFAEPRAAHATPSLTMTVRVGTALAELIYQDEERQPDSAKILLSLARMQAKRLLDVEQGRTPKAMAD